MLRRSTLNTARVAVEVMENNNIHVAGDNTGLHALIFAKAMYPRQLTAALRNYGVRNADVNFCQADEELCEGNVGLPRIKMPVIDPDLGYLDEVTELLENGMLDIYNVPKLGQATPSYLKSGRGRSENQVQVLYKAINVKMLKATQNQLWLGKAISMALTGGGLNEPLVVSKDEYVIDGHHRWAALLLLATYTKDQLAHILRFAQKSDLESVQNMFARFESDVLPSKRILANCAQFQLGYQRLLAVMNAYTDAKGIHRKP